MTAGVPGAGIGGMFYLLAALMSPVWAAVRAVRGDESRRQWQLALRHCSLAASILAGMWIVAALLGLTGTSPTVAVRSKALIDPSYPQAIGRSLVYFTFTTLAAVLAAVELLRLMKLARRGRRRAVLPAHRAPSAPIPAARVVRADDGF